MKHQLKCILGWNESFSKPFKHTIYFCLIRIRDMSKSSKILHQVAIVVNDIEKAVELWSKILGIEKPQISETDTWDQTHMRFLNKPSEARAKLAFFRLDNITIELIQPVGQPSTWNSFLEKHGNGIHHIAFNIDKNLKEVIKDYENIGGYIEQKGKFKGGCYVYINAQENLGAIIELLSKNENECDDVIDK